jgi:two-component system response regulator FixJ
MGLSKGGREILMDVSIRPIQTPQGMFACAAVRDIPAGKTTDVPARTDTPEAGSRLAVLTEREWDVMVKVIQGLPNKVIAFEHGVSQRTVEFQRRSMMTKLGVKTVPDLVRLALAARVAPADGTTPSH